MIKEFEFRLYEEIRKSGLTNMFNLKQVELLSGLKREKIIEIQKNYAELVKKYGN